jgi:hypothetical protein
VSQTITFETWIFCKASSRRAVLQNLISENKFFKKSHHCNTLDTSRLEQLSSNSIFFFSPEFSDTEIISFYKSTIFKHSDKNILSVLFLDGGESKKNEGKDSINFIIEAPFSAESVESLLKSCVETTCSKNEQEKHQKVDTLVNVLLEQLTVVSLDKKNCSTSFKENFLKLKETARKIQANIGSNTELYFDKLTEQLLAEDRKHLYSGASLRVRKKMAAKLKERQKDTLI